MTATGQSYESYLADLSAYPIGEVLPRAKWDSYPSSVAAAVLLSLDQAVARTAQARDLAERIALLSPTGVPVAVLAAPGDEAGFRDASAALAEAALVTYTSGGLVVMHRLTARVIRDHAAAEGTLQDTASGVVARVDEVLGAHNFGLAWRDREDIAVLHRQVEALGETAPDGLRPALCRLRVRRQSYLVAVHDLEQAVRTGLSSAAECAEVFGADHPETLATRNNLAFCLRAAGREQEARVMFAALLADCERALGPGHPMSAKVRDDIEG